MVESEAETEKETTASTNEESKPNISDEGPGAHETAAPSESKNLPEAPSPETTATDAEPIGPGVESLT